MRIQWASEGAWVCEDSSSMIGVDMQAGHTVGLDCLEAKLNSPRKEDRRNFSRGISPNCRIEYHKRNSGLKSYEVISDTSRQFVLIKFSLVEFHSTLEEHFSWKGSSKWTPTRVTSSVKPSVVSYHPSLSE
ncbi:uncharacterized protein LOC134729686 [Pan paniscus]|uniref:uncharacterized protein LOC134729686 n=1 Tax=Pan paniscus TaxID=9597 RepID=UPI000D0A066C|nr:uncharacterized protein LOC112204431 [Pan troglodytes]XP_024201853.1 uncharacterized protein LOC112204431 [Pan troglodytes]XP_024201854.1 uncharacterized protein LOC112204431 [Pan troglodytes]XP_054523229.1 uncharacterized protein LOC112204431 [Pan troglodytes]XP_054523231.1 uncharacterized protein LOC112204431 [Pan troglodytes]XP_054523234.1 uncharacterized protein LOC112204431 [Pan troglodytes]